jgi:cell wall-associated NlpC family hydrolase
MVNSQHQSALPIAGTALGITALSLAAIPILLAGAATTADSSMSSVISGAVCATSGPIAGLTDLAAQNGRTVAAVASVRGGDDAALITLMIGITESGLRQLGNPNDVTAIGLPDQGIGTDHDSLGIFQQRPSWGTAAQRMDPVSSTNLLLDRLLATRDWQHDQPWQVAQAVQQSAYDGAPRPQNNFSAELGGNYKANLGEATRVLNIIKKGSAHLHCEGTGGADTGTTPGGPVGAYGLPVSYMLPSDISDPARTAVLGGLSALGRPYVFGATGPNAFDCSGLMQWAWAKAGIDLPHYTVDQWHSGVATDEAHISPGDLVLTPGSDGMLANPQHVGMYIGRGLVLEAPQTGDVVKVVTYPSFVSAGLSGLRFLA